jgi:hypothetical protein
LEGHRKFKFGEYKRKNLRRGMEMRDEVAAAEAKKEFLLANFEEVKGPLETKCWRWMRGLSDKGCGRVHYKNKMYRAHRLAWIIAKGPIPEGLPCIHRCDKPWCVNAEHLFLGTKY